MGQELRRVDWDQMDPVAQDARARWDGLDLAGGPLTRPWSLESLAEAEARIFPARALAQTRLATVGEGRSALLVGGGGGQQSVALGLLGWRVTVVDLHPAQLERDRKAWVAHGLPADCLKTVQGDMRDLSRSIGTGPNDAGAEEAGFDFVWIPYSINFVPDCRPVIEGLGRQTRSGGTLRVQVANPFVLGMHQDVRVGHEYLRGGRYVDGDRVVAPDPDWVYDRTTVREPVPRAVEYRHTISTVINTIVLTGFVVVHLEDVVDVPIDPHGLPGTWGHFCSVNPPWLTIWARKTDL